jgi:mannose-6-phosphate isomerase-like protein (cupin superfamily)
MSESIDDVPHVAVDDVPGTRADPPYSRTLRHLITPWTLGSQQLWLGLSEVDVGSSSNRHSHANEEAFFVISGRGAVEVGSGRVEVSPGSAVLAPGGQPHRLVNEGDEPMRVLCCAAPAFDRATFDEAHLLAP